MREAHPAPGDPLGPLDGPADPSRAARPARTAAAGPRGRAAAASPRRAAGPDHAERLGAAPATARGRHEGRRFPGSGAIHFIQESIGELKKVEWPNQKAVVSGTAVVLIACVIVGTYLWLNDQLWKYVVQHVLLR